MILSLRQLLGGGLGERPYAELGGAVVAEQVEARVRGDGRGIDDLAAGALRDHLLGRGLHAVDDAEHVDLEDPLQVLGGHAPAAS